MARQFSTAATWAALRSRLLMVESRRFLPLVAMTAAEAPGVRPSADSVAASTTGVVLAASIAAPAMAAAATTEAARLRRLRGAATGLSITAVPPALAPGTAPRTEAARAAMLVEPDLVTFCIKTYSLPCGQTRTVQSRATCSGLRDVAGNMPATELLGISLKDGVLPQSECGRSGECDRALHAFTIVRRLLGGDL